MTSSYKIAKRLRRHYYNFDVRYKNNSFLPYQQNDPKIPIKQSKLFENVNAASHPVASAPTAQPMPNGMPTPDMNKA